MYVAGSCKRQESAGCSIKRDTRLMSDINRDAPNVRIVPPLIYITGVVIGSLVNIWLPTKVLSGPVAWVIGGIIILCGAVLAASAIFTFKSIGTTVRPDRAASTLVIEGPYK